MPRTTRVIMENACYHIITRGNQKQTVFRESKDYEEFLKLLGRYKRKYNFRLYSFCLMPNHVHLLVEINQAPTLSLFMKGLNLSYSLYYNFKYEKVGHLWQSRFKSKLIEKNSYLLECINYIEANPVRAYLINDINQYPWSSNSITKQKYNIIDNLFSD